MTTHTCSSRGCPDSHFHGACLDKALKAVGTKKGRNTGFPCFKCKKGKVIDSSHRPDRKKGKGLLLPPDSPQPPPTPKKASVRPSVAPVRGIRVINKASSAAKPLSLDERLHGGKEAIATFDVPGMTGKPEREEPPKTKTQKRKDKKREPERDAKDDEELLRLLMRLCLREEDKQEEEVEFLTYVCMTGTTPPSSYGYA